MKHYNKLIGNYGEFISREFLIKQGYTIMDTNFKCKLGEIDIISFVSSKNCICFTEVKSRYNTLYGRPSESITYKKIFRLKNIAQYYILKNNLHKFNFRFDVIEILFHIENDTYDINLIENAFN
ncbi:YraN family protein [Clostridium sp. JNZ J1-5]